MILALADNRVDSFYLSCDNKTVPPISSHTILISVIPVMKNIVKLKERPLEVICWRDSKVAVFFHTRRLFTCYRELS